MVDERRKPLEAKPIESGDPSDLMNVGQQLIHAVEALETNVDRATRRRTLLITFVSLVLIVVLVIGSWMVNDQRQGNEQRAQIKAAVQEIKDCTTPSQDNACQRRLAEGQVPVLRALSEDNLRASVSVGTCLRAQAPDVEACALAEFARRTAAADKARQAPPP